MNWSPPGPGPCPVFGHSNQNQAGDSMISNSEVSPVVAMMSLRMQFGEQCLLVYTLAFLVVGVKMRSVGCIVFVRAMDWSRTVRV
jgi:hypothetical protein